MSAPSRYVLTSLYQAIADQERAGCFISVLC